MGVSINRFNGGLDQDINIQDCSNQKYFDALNMRILSKGDLQIGSLENEKGMVASLTLTSGARIYTFDITTSGTWIGTLAIAGEAGSPFSLNTTTDKFVSAIPSTPESVPEDENAPPTSPKYAGLKTATFEAYQYVNRIVIVTLTGQAVTLTKDSGTGTITPTNPAYITVEANQRILGYTTLREKMIVFSTADANSGTPSSTNGFIWKITFNTAGTVYATELIYGGTLNFSKTYPISAKSMYINDRYGKVYFTDSYNNLRHFNAYDPVLFAKQPNQFDLISDVVFTKPKIVDVIDGGNYNSGVVQYAYQLYNKYGSESIMSPVSNLVPLTSYSDSYGSTDYFVADPIHTQTGKAVNVSIGTLDSRFEYIRIFALFYESDLSNPEIRMVADQKIVLRDSNFGIVDDGFVSLGTLTLQEFRNYYKNLFGAKSIELQNNRLIAANLKESFFDVTYDARAYRHRSNGTFSIDQGSDVAGNNTNWTAVNAYANCVPTYSSIPSDFYATYKYKADGTTVGGQGKNISYTFGVAEMELDSLHREFYKFGAAKRNQAWSGITGGSAYLSDNYSYTNYASPINASQMVGYKRGETYRFGILFRDSKGRISPVKWIGDIKMPEIYDAVGTSYTQVTGATQQYYSNYADQFPIKLRTEIPEDVYDLYSNNPASHYVNFGLNDTHQFEIVIGTTTYRSDPVTHTTGTEYSLADYIQDVKDFLNAKGLDSVFEFTYGITPNANPESRTAYFKFLVKNKDPLTATINIKLNFSTTSDYTFANTAGSAGTTSAVTTTNEYVINKVDTDTTNKITARVLYPIFTVSNIPTDEWGNTCSYQIVRAERTDRDKTIIAQGLLTDTVVADKDSSVYVPQRITETSLLNKTIVSFISPEINFRKVGARNSDDLILIGNANSITTKDGECVKVNSVTSRASFTTLDIVDSGIIQSDLDALAPKLQRVKDYRIYNTVITSKEDSDPIALGGTSMFIATVVTEALYAPIAEIRRTLVDQYGGNTYYDRLNTQYIDTGHWRAGTDSTNTNPVFGGDTYICIFDYQRAMWVDKNYLKDGGTKGGFSAHLFLPVETSINLDYRYDYSYTKARNFFGETARYLQEFAGDYSGKVGLDTDDKQINYVQDYDLYLENPVYSKSNNINKYIAQPLEQDGEETDCMIRVSEQFSYNSTVDDLIRFLPINFKIVDTQYGKINHLTNHKNSILFFQDRAIGMQPIAERTVLQDNRGIGLVLGTGDLFGQHQYLSTTSGAKMRNSILTTDYGVYYFDNQSKSLNRIGKGVEEISTLKGLSSYFQTNVLNAVLQYDNPLSGSGIHLGYDKANKRVFMTFLYDTTKWTVSYNELSDSFESFHTFTPRIYFTDPHGNLHSENPSSFGAFYAHGKGNYGLYYGSYADSTVTFIHADQPNVNKRYSNLELDYRIGASSNQSSTDTYRADLITKLKFWNDYQTTIDLPVVTYTTPPTTGTNIGARQKFGIWRYAIPLSSTNSPTSDAGTRNTRFFDKHLFTKITYTNTSSNKRLLLNNAVTYYEEAPL